MLLFSNTIVGIRNTLDIALVQRNQITIEMAFDFDFKNEETHTRILMNNA